MLTTAQPGAQSAPPIYRIVLRTVNAVVRATEEYPGAIFYVYRQPILRDLLRRIIDTMPSVVSDPAAAHGAFTMDLPERDDYERYYAAQG